MRLEQLEYLIQIYTWGSYNTAEKYLYISHQQLSRAIQQLENELGIKIFGRSSKGIHITDAGQDVLNFANTVILEHKKLQELLKVTLNTPCHPNMSFNASLTAGMGLIFNAITQNFKNVTHYNIKEHTLNECLQNANETNQYDIILLQHKDTYFSNHTKAAKNYHLYLLFSEHLELTMHPCMPYAKYQSIPISLLENIPLISFSQGTDSSNLVQICTESNLKFNVLYRTNIEKIINELLYNGKCCALSLPSIGSNVIHPLFEKILVHVPIAAPLQIATALYIKKDFFNTEDGQMLSSTINRAYSSTIKKLF